MPFRKNDLNINRSGRPIGAVSKLNLAREIILDVFFENSNTFKDYCQQQASKDIGQFYKTFVLPVMPKAQAVEITDKSSYLDNEILEILDHKDKNSPEYQRALMFKECTDKGWTIDEYLKNKLKLTLDSIETTY